MAAKDCVGVSGHLDLLVRPSRNPEWREGLSARRGFFPPNATLSFAAPVIPQWRGDYFLTG